MTTPLLQIDAFATEPFTGNPAAVCLPDEMPPDGWMQQLAAEMNLSETAYVVPRGEGFDLRWCTPVCEVPLCGHATLASAHALWATGRVAPDAVIRFFTRSGELRARRTGDLIEIDLPAQPVDEHAAPAGLAAALGADVVSAHQTRERDDGDRDHLLELDSEAAVRGLTPDFAALRGFGRVGFVVTAAGAEHDFVSRYFAPAFGIDEDPVTGSAHCCLSPFWSRRTGRRELVGFQASPRGGTVRTRLAGDRVFLAGGAVTVMEGAVTLPVPVPA